MFKDNQLTWSYRFLKYYKILLVLSFLALILSGFFSDKANPAALLFLSVCTLFLLYIASNIEMALHKRKSQAWAWATLLSFFSLLSPLFPLAIMSLKELLKRESRNDYIKNCDVTPKEERSRMRIALTATIFASATYGAYLFWGYLDQQPIFYRVAKGKLEFNVAPHLSMKELYALGAECNTYGNTKCSVAVFVKILERNPGDRTALANLAMAQTHIGDHKSAVINYRRAIDMGALTYDVLAFYGKSLYELGQKDKALIYYRKAYTKNPRLIDIAKKLGYLLFEMERFQEAFEIVDRFIEEHPESVEELEELHEQLRSQI